MAVKANKGGKTPEKKTLAKETTPKASPKPKKQFEEDEDDDLDLDEPAAAAKGSKKAAGPAKNADDDEDDDLEDLEDDWNKEEDEEEWDPDFDEFDIPKSRGGKEDGPLLGKKGKGEEFDDDFKLDDDFSDLDFGGGKGKGGFDDDYDDF